ncbi:hypothetical protein ACOJQ7_22985 [Streptomyces bohaiensis]
MILGLSVRKPGPVRSWSAAAIAAAFLMTPAITAAPDEMAAFAPSAVLVILPVHVRRVAAAA